MPISSYIAGLRAHVGHDLLMIPGVSAVVRNDRGHILLGRRSDDGSWGLPALPADAPAWFAKPGEQPRALNHKPTPD
jgi:8-oxo-dGTP diphosphatase